MAWFKLKCPYPPNSHAQKQTYNKRNGASYADLEELRAEFYEYEENTVRKYKQKGKWYAKAVSGGTAQEVNMEGIYRGMVGGGVYSSVEMGT